MAMNSKESRSKFGKLDDELNYLSKLLFAIMASCALILLLLQGGAVTGSWFIIFFRYLLLCANIIPISMRVNLDFAKLIYCYKINNDE